MPDLFSLYSFLFCLIYTWNSLQYHFSGTMACTFHLSIDELNEMTSISSFLEMDMYILWSGGSHICLVVCAHRYISNLYKCFSYVKLLYLRWFLYQISWLKQRSASFSLSMIEFVQPFLWVSFSKYVTWPTLQFQGSKVMKLNLGNLLEQMINEDMLTGNQWFIGSLEELLHFLISNLNCSFAARGPSMPFSSCACIFYYIQVLFPCMKYFFKLSCFCLCINLVSECSSGLCR